MRRRFRFLLLGLLAITLSACKAPTRDQIVTALTDAGWGLKEGCSREWVPARDCTILLDGLEAGVQVAKQAPLDMIKPAVRKVLVDAVALLPADSHGKDFVDYVIAWLA